VVGTPDQMVAAIHRMQEITGGFGVVMGFAHDWANPENTLRSWDLFARYVVPEVRGLTANLRDSQRYLHDNQAELMGGAGRAIMAKVAETAGASDAMQITAERNRRRAQSGAQTEFRPGGA
jgi:limonene 1,2-monooxygenase